MNVYQNRMHNSLLVIHGEKNQKHLKDQSENHLLASSINRSSSFFYHFAKLDVRIKT